MYELPYLAVIELAGRDAGKFLQAQLAADIDRLQTAAAGFAGLCQMQGRVLALLLVVRHAPDHYQLVCARSLVDTVLARLRPYILRDDVRIEARPSARVEGFAGATVDAPVLVPVSGLQYRIVSEAGSSDESAAARTFRAEELLRGVAWLDSETSGAFLPQMLGHEEIGALSFRKGCFPGQEIIARTRYLGRLKQRALVLQFDGDTLPADVALSVQGDTQSADAMLVDQAVSGAGSRVALLVVRATEPFPVTGVDVAGALRPAQGRWLEASTKRPDAA